MHGQNHIKFSIVRLGIAWPTGHLRHGASATEFWGVSPYDDPGLKWAPYCYMRCGAGFFRNFIWSGIHHRNRPWGTDGGAAEPSPVSSNAFHTHDLYTPNSVMLWLRGRGVRRRMGLHLLSVALGQRSPASHVFVATLTSAIWPLGAIAGHSYTTLQPRNIMPSVSYSSYCRPRLVNMRPLSQNRFCNPIKRT